MTHPNVICTEIVEKITKLHEQIKRSDLRLPEDIRVLFTSDLNHHRFDRAIDLLNQQYEASQGVHQLWDLGYEACRLNRDFSALFWMLTFEHFANKLGVPLSWIAALRFGVDLERRSWVLKKMQNSNGPGGCNESIWAAHVDGVESGLIDNPAFGLTRMVEVDAKIEVA